MSRTLVSLVVVASLCIGLVGYAAPKPKPPASAPPVRLAAPTKQQIEAARKAGKVQVSLRTDKGTILLELDGKAAPLTVANFENLVNAGFYNGMPFHRVERQPKPFVIQAGDPALAGRPPEGYTIPDEKSPLRHDKAGVLAMARLYRGGQMVPNSASTQFYITLAPTPHLDGYGFTVFGRVIKGMDVVDKIRVNDKILEATVVSKAGKTK